MKGRTPMGLDREFSSVLVSGIHGQTIAPARYYLLTYPAGRRGYHG